jgi:hypothetical protein
MKKSDKNLQRQELSQLDLSFHYHDVPLASHSPMLHLIMFLTWLFFLSMCIELNPMHIDTIVDIQQYWFYGSTAIYLIILFLYSSYISCMNDPNYK